MYMYIHIHIYISYDRYVRILDLNCTNSRATECLGASHVATEVTPELRPDLSFGAGQRDLRFPKPKGPSTTFIGVQRTNMWCACVYIYICVYAFYTRNRDTGFGNTLCTWVLGRLGL